MNLKRLQKINRDETVMKNEEGRGKSSEELFRRWRATKLGALVYSVPFVSSVLYLAFWAFSLDSWERFQVLPVDVSLCLGMMAISLFGGFAYMVNHYRCPKCEISMGVDWSFGFSTLLQGEEAQKEREYCRYCRATLEK